MSIETISYLQALVETDKQDADKAQKESAKAEEMSAHSYFRGYAEALRMRARTTEAIIRAMKMRSVPELVAEET